MNFSFWESEGLNNYDNIIIVGGGIVGLSTALSLKEKLPDSTINVVEPYWPPQGASTKNAGFICYGSLSEVLSDLNEMTTDSAIALIKMRYSGSQLLKKRIKPSIFQNTGGYELFKSGEFPSDSIINKGNLIFKEATGISDYFQVTPNSYFPLFNKDCISLPKEGMLNPYLMMESLKERSLLSGVKFIHGFKVKTVNQKQKEIQLDNEEKLIYDKCIVCTNAFTKCLLPSIEITPARNMVIMVKPDKHVFPSGVYHFDEGYYYFRSYKDKVLIGGARNLDPVTETTTEFGINNKIRKHLNDFLKEFVLGNMNYKVLNEWSGILGISKNKTPIMKHLGNNLFVGARLGGMGVAIGSYMGEQMAELIINTEA